jgi:PAS domain-containing protein
LELTCRDGSKKLIAWSNESIQYPIPGWATWGVGVDVTDRRQAERQLEAAHLELRQIFHAATPMNVIDKNFTILQINQTFVEKYQVRPEEIIG